MEIKATLQKPYEEKDRLDFIIEQNHTNGYEIKETETALEAWGKTEAEKQEQAKQARKAELIAELVQIDLESIRPTRAIQNGTATEYDTQKLAELEERAEQIRQEIRDLSEEELDNQEEID